MAVDFGSRKITKYAVISSVNVVKKQPGFTAYSISGTIVFHLVSSSTIKAYNRSFLETTEHITDAACFLLGVNKKFKFFKSFRAF